MTVRFDSFDKLYKPIETVKKISGILFVINLILTFTVFFVNEIPNIKNLLLGIFIVTTILYFIADNFLSIYLIPSVEEKRRLHLLTNSFGIPLENERTNKYYNNNIEPSFLKLGANVLESSLMAKKVTSEMAIIERKKILVLGLLWIVFLVFRNDNLEFISIAGQTLFASTLIPSWLKLEVLRKQNEKIYNNLYILFLSYRTTDSEKLLALILDAFVKYEAAKAFSGVKQSTEIFEKLKSELIVEWEEIKRNLGLEQ